MDKTRKSSVKEILLCPFDGLPCEFVDSCDEILAESWGIEPEYSCSRAVRSVRLRK